MILDATKRLWEARHVTINGKPFTTRRKSLRRFAEALAADPDPRIEVRRRAAKAELKWESK